MRNVADKPCRGNQNAHFVFNKFFSDILPFLEIMWKDMVRADRPQVAKKHGAEKMRFAFRITKVRIQTHTHNTRT